MTRLQKYGFLAHVLFGFSLVWVSLRFFSLNRTLSFFSSRLYFFPKAGSAEVVRWAVEAWARRVFFLDNCLCKSVAGCFLLRRAGIEGQLRIGATEKPEFKAHAWVTVNDVCLIGNGQESGYRPLFVAAVALFLVFFATGVAWAADFPLIPDGASAAVTNKKARKSFEDELKKIRMNMEIETQPELPTEPTGEEKPFFVRDIELEGNTVISQEDLDKMLGSFEEREHTISSLNQICRALEAETQRRGVVTVIYLPPQRLENQSVKLKVLVPKMGELFLEGEKYYKKEATLRYWHIQKGEELNYDRLRAEVLKMNENPDRQVRVFLRPGKTQGETNVHLRQQDRNPFHSTAMIDNQGVKLTGKYRPSLSIRHNNFTGRDDVFFANGTLAKDIGLLYLSHILPLPEWDVRLLTHYSYARVSPKKDFKVLDYEALSTDYGVQIRKWLIKENSEALDGFIRVRFNDRSTRALATPLAKDHLKIVGIGGDYQTGDQRGVWSISPTASFGLPYHDNDDFNAITSRQAGSSFTKFAIQGSRVQKLAWDTSGLVSVQAQWTPNDLVPQEQIFFGGADSVRGYAESDYGADNGIVTNIEWHIPPQFIPAHWNVMESEKSLKEQTDFFVFFDHGYGRLANAQPNDHETGNLYSCGIGFNVQLDDHMQVKISWGFPLGDAGLTESSNSQVHLRVVSFF